MFASQYLPPPEQVEIIEKYRKLLSVILKTDKFSLVETSSKVAYDEKLNLGKWQLRDGCNTTISSFELYPMINCCGICVSTQAQVSPSYRNRGLGTLLNSFRIDVARCMGYSLLICTDVIKNEYQRKVLAANGWRDLYRFINRRTANEIAISCIAL